MNSESKAATCIVIGAGIGGMAASIRLAKAGYRVQLLEKNSEAGGNLTALHRDGFRFDAGPSILTKPEYIDELFLLWNKDPRDYINYLKVDPLFRYFFPDGSSIDLFTDREKLRKEIAAKSSEPFEHVNELLEDSSKIYGLTHRVFLERSLHRFRNYFDRATWHGILNFRKVRAFRSMHAYNRKKFSDERLVRLFDNYASFNGSSPYEAPATLNVITHFAVNEGSYLPVGGMHTITKALQKLAEEAGVEIRTGMPVKKIIVEGKKVTGVETDAGFREAGTVVCNADAGYVYHHLLNGKERHGKSMEGSRSSSVIVFYWGINKIFPQIELHNNFFGINSREEYDAVFHRQRISEDPSIYLYNSSQLIKTDAPAGMSNWFVMVTAPPDSGQDWKTMVEQARKKALIKLSAALGETVSASIVTEEVLSPPLIEEKTHALQGSIYGNNSNGIFSAFLRHPNFSRKIKGLYFCGGSVHPGAGIPLCLLSARITAELIQQKKR